MSIENIEGYRESFADLFLRLRDHKTTSQQVAAAPLVVSFSIFLLSYDLRLLTTKFSSAISLIRSSVVPAKPNRLPPTVVSPASPLYPPKGGILRGGLAVGLTTSPLSLVLR